MAVLYGEYGEEIDITDFARASLEERERLKEEASRLLTDSIREAKEYQEVLQRLQFIMERASQRLRERALRVEAMAKFRELENEIQGKK